MKTGNKPAGPTCALGRVQVSEIDVESIKQEGWQKHGILVVRADDERLGWIERKIIADLGQKLYGRKEARRV